MAECDWIIEVVIENLAIKKSLLAKVAEHRTEGTVVTSNTSGLPIGEICEDLPEEMQRHFLGTHFFNPVRYMKLLEIIPHAGTDPEVACSMAEFGERVLGKGIVWCKDTPNFVANRIGCFGMIRTMQLMDEMGYSIEEVDKITGPALARPSSASFRTADLAGIDTFFHVCNNMVEAASDEEEKEAFRPTPLLTRLFEEKRLGDKTGGGFFKKSRDASGKRVILAVDPSTGDYRPAEKVEIESLKAARGIDDPAERVRHTVQADDRAGAFAWAVTRDALVYSARRMEEIAGSVVDVDRGMRWGYNWELGPFETWDAIGVRAGVDRMKADGVDVPGWVTDMLDAGHESFYVTRDGDRHAYDAATGDHAPEQHHPRVILLPSLKDREKTVRSNASASLVDLGDGVACVEFHCKMNAVDPDLISMLDEAVDEVDRNFEGLVIANHDPRAFSAGANLLLVYAAGENGDWDQIEQISKAFQDANMKLKTSPKPVVVAPAGLALGGGCEIILHGARVRAHAELYCGLVEVGVGLIPGGGGCKELALRAVEGAPLGGQMPLDITPFVFSAFEKIALAKTSTSASEARGLGILGTADGITMNRDHLIGDAKAEVLHLAAMGYRRALPRTDVQVGGHPTRAALVLAVDGLRRSGFATDHDMTIAKKLARVMSGGDAAPGSTVSEQHLLDLEREAFVSLCGEEKSRERMKHMLMTNKPLRN